jgi:Flp pilus assembly protein TadB
MSEKRLSRPLYEALPWLYILCGLAALVASYLTRSHAMSFVLGLPGLVAMLGGIVVLLRRRDFRRMRASYGNPDSSVLPKREELK